MCEFVIKNKRTGLVRRIYGETAGNAFRRFGLEQDSWILIQKREMDSEDGGQDGQGRRK